jgi:hypothetical protein
MAAFPTGDVYFQVKVNLVSAIGIPAIRGYAAIVPRVALRTGFGFPVLETRSAFLPFFLPNKTLTRPLI